MMRTSLDRNKGGINIRILNSLIIGSLILVSTLGAMATEENSGITADQAMKNLMEGNARFVSGNAIHPDQSIADRRAELVTSQHPFAVIVTCSDSRVPPEIVFDQGLGDIFVIRTAGEVMDNVTLGSIEYAVDHLNVPLVLILGHDGCGAVDAVVSGGEAHGHIVDLVEAIKPAVETARKMKGDLLNNSIDVNTQNIVAKLKSSEPILSLTVKQDKLKILGARYHLDSGMVNIMG
jgi:carbonic anhydrase